MAVINISGGISVTAAMALNQFAGFSNIQILEIYWFNPAAIGDTFTVQDGSGMEVRTGRCETANQSQVFYERLPVPRVLTNLIVTQLSSGTLKILFRHV